MLQRLRLRRCGAASPASLANSAALRIPLLPLLLLLISLCARLPSASAAGSPAPPPPPPPIVIPAPTELHPAAAWTYAARAPTAIPLWPLHFSSHDGGAFYLTGDARTPLGPFRATFAYRSAAPGCTPGTAAVYEAQLYDAGHFQPSGAQIEIAGPHGAASAPWPAARPDRSTPWVAQGLVNLCGADGHLQANVTITYRHPQLAEPLPELVADAVRLVPRSVAAGGAGAPVHTCDAVYVNAVKAMQPLPAGATSVPAGARFYWGGDVLSLPSLDVYGELYILPQGPAPAIVHLGALTVREKEERES